MARIETASSSVKKLGCKLMKAIPFILIPFAAVVGGYLEWADASLEDTIIIGLLSSAIAVVTVLFIAQISVKHESLENYAEAKIIGYPGSYRQWKAESRAYKGGTGAGYLIAFPIIIAALFFLWDFLWSLVG